MYLLVLFGDTRTWQNLVVCRELIESTQTKPSKNVKMATAEGSRVRELFIKNLAFEGENFERCYWYVF